MWPFSIGTLSTGSKNGVPFLGPRFGRRSTATTFTLELAFGTMKSGRGSKKQCQMQSDNLYDYMWHPVIFAQLQPKRAGWFQLAACTHVRTGSCTLQQQFLEDLEKIDAWIVNEKQQREKVRELRFSETIVLVLAFLDCFGTTATCA